jgi:hypothetical protein
VNENQQAALTKLGFRFGTNGPHAARTMMFDELNTLLHGMSPQSTMDDYVQAVVEHNKLGKPTKKARELSLRHLTALYGLSPKFALFRAFRRLWEGDEVARPVLALSASLARDPLLRSSLDFILEKQLGEGVTREEVEKIIVSSYPDRFSPASLKSFAQNINGTWTRAGYLVGRSTKSRVLPIVRPANVAFSLFLGHMEGLSGQRLFSSSWANLLGRSVDELETIASAASHRGLLLLINAGGVKEVRFPEYLTAEEEQWRKDASHV